MLAQLIALLLASGAGAGAEKSVLGTPPPSSTVDTLGSVVGSLELITGTPAANCIVRVDGTSRASRCDANGFFEIPGLDPGTWHLTITVTVPATAQILSHHTIVGVTADAVTTLAPIPMTRPITIGGRVARVTFANSGLYYVAVSALGLAAPLSPAGTFVLSGLPPGMHRLELRAFGQQDIREPDAQTATVIEVRPGPVALYSGLRAPFAPVRATPSRPEVQE